MALGTAAPQIKSEIQTGNVFPVLLNLSLPTISSNPPLEFDPVEMMKETLAHHTQPSKLTAISTKVFVFATIWYKISHLLPLHMIMSS